MPANKSDFLREEGALNPRPEMVADGKFRQGEFFDPRDLVQVKYELLRRVRTEAVSVTQAVTEFGCSRPTFYKAKANFERAGVAGLVSQKRGPRGRHKLRPEVMDYLTGLVVPGQPVRARELARMVLERFGLSVHPRSIERAMGSPKKKKG